MTIITKGMGAIFKGGAKKTTTTSVSGNQLLNKLSEIKNRPALKETFTPKAKLKSDFRLKNQLKKIQKTPNKEFTKVNLKMPEDGSTVKGKVGKKNYSKETRRYHQAHKRMGLIKD